MEPVAYTNVSHDDWVVAEEEPVTNEEMGYDYKVAAELLPLLVPIGSLYLMPDNPRTHRVDKIAMSLQRHGQRSPLVVDANSNIVVKGNGTLEAAQALGWTHVAAVFQTFDNPEHALDYSLSDNRPSDLAGYKKDLLLKQLDRLLEQDLLSDSLWEPGEIEDLREELMPMVELPPRLVQEADEESSEADEREGATEPLQGEKLHEIPILLNGTEYARFIENLRVVQARYNIRGFKDTTLHAVELAADAIRGEHKEPGA